MAPIKMTRHIGMVYFGKPVPGINSYEDMLSTTERCIDVDSVT